MRRWMEFGYDGTTFFMDNTVGDKVFVSMPYKEDVWNILNRTLNVQTALFVNAGVGIQAWVCRGTYQDMPLPAHIDIQGFLVGIDYNPVVAGGNLQDSFFQGFVMPGYPSTPPIFRMTFEPPSKNG